MGDSLIVLTYHEAGMGAPDELCIGGIHWRAMEWYGMAMGGAVANGYDAQNINVVGPSHFTANPIKMIADFAVTSAKGADQNTLNISVTVTAKAAIPANTKLLVFITENQIDWQQAYGITPKSAQTFMYDVLCDIVTDSLGAPVPQLAAGGSFSYTGSHTTNSHHNKDSLRVVAYIQVEDTKEILSAAKTKISPFSTGIIPKTSIPALHGLRIAYSGPNRLFITAPFGDGTLFIYNGAGRVLNKRPFSGRAGQPVPISLPEVQGMLFIKITSEGGLSAVVPVPLLKR